MNPSVSRIRIYPVKSLDPVDLDEVMINKSSLLHDREFAIINKEGKYVNGKFTPAVNKLRSVFDLNDLTITINEEGKESYHNFSLTDNTELNDYLSDYFGYEVFVEQNKEGRFLDIPDMSGLTILSESTINKLNYFFPEISSDQMRLRFRANIEISNTEAFWEDKLFGEPESVIEFKINDVTLFGISPRARCIVPTRDSFTGETYPQFAKRLADSRKQTLPQWSDLKEYDHYYFLSTDVFIPDSEQGKIIKTGDEVTITGKRDLSILNF